MNLIRIGKALATLALTIVFGLLIASVLTAPGHTTSEDMVASAVVLAFYFVFVGLTWSFPE